MPIFPGKPSKAKLIAALMVSNEGLIERALAVLEPAYGAVELYSPVFAFTYSDYYKKEMGERLLKVYCSFRKLIVPDDIVYFKLAAIECEKNFLRDPSQGSSTETVSQRPPTSGRTDSIELNMTPKAASAGAGDRSVNIDPGYVERTKLVLATTKDCSHRIYIGQGIYGDVELIYKSGSFVSLEWTYPDYRVPLAAEFFNKVRSAYLAELRELSQTPQE